MGTSMNNTTMNDASCDIRSGAVGMRRQTHGTRAEMLPRGLFVADALARGLRHIICDDLRGVGTLDALRRCGTPVLVHSDRDADEVDAYLQMGGGALALVDMNHGHLEIEVAASTHQAARDAFEHLRRELIVDAPPAERISLGFWMCGEYGGNVRHRDIDAEPFAAIAQNYPSSVRSGLEQLVATRSPERGRLILWRGAPGTGKSHALRSLAHEWKPWCSMHFIMDPEELLGRGGAYMLDVLTWEGGEDEDRWRLLILEDAGELIASGARTATGQALSRLLNVADGLLGQGTRTLVLITTNEPVGQLHPAVRRPGRCLADIEFTPFSAAEANAWLAAHGQAALAREPMPLAELFSRTSGTVVANAAPQAGFGFARALPHQATRDAPHEA